MNARDAYLVDALVQLAAVYPDALTVAEVARRRAIPAPFLGRLLASAARHRLVTTLRGPHGGVRLARPPASVRLADVLDTSPPKPSGGPAARWLARELHASRLGVLGRLSLEDLRDHERQATAALDWNI